MTSFSQRAPIGLLLLECLCACLRLCPVSMVGQDDTGLYNSIHKTTPSFQGVLEPTVADSNRGFSSRYFLVPKKMGDVHPILDLRVLNSYVAHKSFRMLTVHQLLKAVQSGDWFVTVDPKDAYFHVAIWYSHQKFLPFAFQGSVYQYSIKIPLFIST